MNLVQLNDKTLINLDQMVSIEIKKGEDARQKFELRDKDFVVVTISNKSEFICQIGSKIAKKILHAVDFDMHLDPLSKRIF